MSRIRFRAGAVNLELSGSEPFMVRQLQLLSPYLGQVDSAALDGADRSLPPGPLPESSPEPVEEPKPTNGRVQVVEAPPVQLPKGGKAGKGGEDGEDGLVGFFRAHEPVGGDRQAGSALLFAYYLQEREGRRAVDIGDLIRCCIRAGVDTRNFNRTLGGLTRRGLLQALRHGHRYRLSEQGAKSVEQRVNHEGD